MLCTQYYPAVSPKRFAGHRSGTKMAANRGFLLAKREAAFEVFRAEFTKEGYVHCRLFIGSLFSLFHCIILFYRSLTIPEGLIALLKTSKVKAHHSPDESRAWLYKRLWCILWVSRYTLRKGHSFSIKVEEVLH